MAGLTGGAHDEIGRSGIELANDIYGVHHFAAKIELRVLVFFQIHKKGIYKVIILSANWLTASRWEMNRMVLIP